IILFINQREEKHTIFAFSNGTWFQILGQPAGDKIAWSFTHLEPYLRRTFKGTTGELKKIIQDSLAGKIKPPPPNEKEPPGIGPEVKTSRQQTSGQWPRGQGPTRDHPFPGSPHPPPLPT